jgi:DNA-binding LytR/AlgR family response regulator
LAKGVGGIEDTKFYVQMEKSNYTKLQTKMRIVIIEDEMYAAKRLENMIKEYDPEIEIAAWLESVSDSVKWFSQNENPDLIFLDIHLEDDLSFAIFEKVSVSSSIVFTTATDELAIKAFITKGIDFLHKPVVKTELVNMLEKYSHQENQNRKPIGAGFFSDLINNKE